MSATTAVNGKPRKQLSDQLDRLDGIIDALAEGQNSAVADAAREGTRLAVKDAIVEIVTNPELRALIAPAAPASAPASTSASAPDQAHDYPLPVPPVSVWARLKARLAAAKYAVGRTADTMTGKVVLRYRAVRDGITAVAQATGEVLRVRRVLWVAAGNGVLTGLACQLVPHTMAAAVGAVGGAVGAVGGAVTAASVQVGKWLRRAAQRISLV